MYIRLDDDVHTANAVERDLNIFVVSPVAHACHVFPTSGVLLVACWLLAIGLIPYLRLFQRTLCQYNVLVQTRCELSALVRLLP